MTTETSETTMQVTQEQIEALRNKNVAVLTIMMPPGVRDAINDAAEREGTSAATWARSALAEKLGIELPKGKVRTSKYATEEEKQAANKAAAKSRREQVNELLAALKRGDIQL